MRLIDQPLQTLGVKLQELAEKLLRTVAVDDVALSDALLGVPTDNHPIGFNAARAVYDPYVAVGNKERALGFIFKVVRRDLDGRFAGRLRISRAGNEDKRNEGHKCEPSSHQRR